MGADQLDRPARNLPPLLRRIAARRLIRGMESVATNSRRSQLAGAHRAASRGARSPLGGAQ
jgi:hypothetical protein